MLRLTYLWENPGISILTLLKFTENEIKFPINVSSTIFHFIDSDEEPSFESDDFPFYKKIGNVYWVYPNLIVHSPDIDNFIKAIKIRSYRPNNRRLLPVASPEGKALLESAIYADIHPKPAAVGAKTKVVPPKRLLSKLSMYTPLAVGFYISMLLLRFNKPNGIYPLGRFSNETTKVVASEAKRLLKHFDGHEMLITETKYLCNLGLWFLNHEDNMVKKIMRHEYSPDEVDLLDLTCLVRGYKKGR